MILSLSTILIFDFGIVPKMCFFSFGFGFDVFVLTAIQNLLARK
jgi:hypothetical protein